MPDSPSFTNDDRNPLGLLAQMARVRPLTTSQLHTTLDHAVEMRDVYHLRTRAIRCVLKERSAPDSNGACFLELRPTSDGPRHFLNGRVVQIGDELEYRFPGGGSEIGRYEWDFNEDSLPILNRQQPPWGYFALDPELDARLRFVNAT